MSFLVRPQVEGEMGPPMIWQGYAMVTSKQNKTPTLIYIIIPQNVKLVIYDIIKFVSFKQKWRYKHYTISKKFPIQE